jgi:ATP-dependent RNA helicase DeaD
MTTHNTQDPAAAPGTAPADSALTDITPEAAAEAAAPAGPTFAELGIGPEVQTALAEMGYTAPMKVQATTIPLVQAGRDLMVQSRTGSGKTAAFGIPVIDKVVKGDDKFVQAIILLPTRELALQVASELTRISVHTGITVVPVYGGAPMGRQIEQLKAGGQIVCGTPGRIMDHMRRGTLVLDRVRCAILDECDEMLSMGFQEDIEKILERTPTERQTLLFSATVPDGIQRLSRRFMRDPQQVKLSTGSVSVSEIRHVYYTIPGGQRENELLRVLAFENPGRAIVFCNTREETGRVAEFLRRQGFDSEALSSDLGQSDRERVMARMRAGDIRYLVATDVAARGIDLEALSHVINYTFPESPEVYIHRTGRTGRAGRHGTAISLIGPTEVGAFYYVKLLYKIKPEERSLPSEAEIRSKREGERIESMRARHHAEPGAPWRSLARRLMGAVDGERLIAALLSDTFANEKSTVAAPTPAVSIVEARPEARRDGPSRSGRDSFRDRGRGDRGGDRPRNGERPREGERFRGGERPPRDFDRPRDARLRDGEAPRAIPAVAPDAAPGVTPDLALDRDLPTPVSAESRPGREPRESREPREPRPPRIPRAEAAPAGESLGKVAPAEAGAPSLERSERPPERERTRRVRPERTPRDVRPDDRGVPAAAPAAARPEGPRRGGRSPGGEQEFWSVWSDNSSGAPSGSAPGGSSERAAGPAGDAPARAPRTQTVEAVSLSTGPAEGEARLFLNLGRKDEASSDEVSALFADLGVNVTPADIDLMNTHAYVNVPAVEADRLCAGLSGRDRNGRPLLCERARPRRR